MQKKRLPRINEYLSCFSKIRETPILQACYRLLKRETCVNTYSQSYPLYPQPVVKVIHFLCINKRSFVDNLTLFPINPSLRVI